MPRETSGQLVEREFLTLPMWDRLDMQTAETVARAVEQCLPEPWKFIRVAWHECGDQKRHVAFFGWHDDVEFALIPGGEMTLGWDRADRGQFDLKIIADAETQLRYCTVAEADIWEYLDTLLTPQRIVSFNPFLAEITTCEPENAPKPGSKQEIDSTTFRLPTTDEWEYAFAGTWKPGQWFTFAVPLSFAQLLKVHPFGLRYAADQKENNYYAEYVYELNQVRGGDGGTNDGTGYTGLLAFLPEAPAYQPEECTTNALLKYGKMRSRRVFQLPDTMFG